MNASAGVWPSGRPVAILGGFEDIVVSDTTPSAAQLGIDGNQFKSGATVGTGERPCHFQDPRRGLHGLDAQRPRPWGRWVRGVGIAGWNELRLHHVTKGCS